MEDEAKAPQGSILGGQLAAHLPWRLHYSGSDPLLSLGVPGTHTGKYRKTQDAVKFEPGHRNPRGLGRPEKRWCWKGQWKAREGLSRSSRLPLERLLGEWVQLLRCDRKWDSYNTSFTDFTALQWASEKITHRRLTEVIFRLVVFQEYISPKYILNNGESVRIDSIICFA